jgi:aspartyl-tRNA(Asn)/glutamyl-tRNA(Gln) amidotransferase subunit A
MLTPDTWFISVRTLGDALRERRMSSVELTDGFLERARTIGKSLNAFVTLTPELAMAGIRYPFA